ncbi:hypothetical protein KUH32_15680 [Thalassococcus sp. CAU 1522]|uniref:Apolipoprotein acyltransferase n=1 Tax=Thalassococcus arenae TaxID=2851652 RepID=A0ABS6NB16_9RHOB|nr:hypothetical protein [Thalassococcus arenae]MBV2361204.1 hypothetical protein [Thalassococcus arenae]
MLAQLLHETAGVGLGVFAGALLGFGIRARSGKTEGLVRGSVFFTAVLAGMVAWVAMAAIRGMIG